MSHLLRIIKKGIVSVFIVATIWIQVSINLGYNFAIHRPSSLANVDLGLPAQVANYTTYLQWQAARVSALAGLTTVWRMATPPERYNWSYVLVAYYQDGSNQIVDDPLNLKRTFWQRNFTNYLQVTYELNLYRLQSQTEAWALNVCKTRSQPRNRIIKVKVKVRRSEIPSYSTHRKGSYVNLPEDEFVMGEYLCPDL